MAATPRAGSSWLFSSQTALLFLTGGLAWALLAWQSPSSLSGHVVAMSFLSFLPVWSLMLAAMMLPSTAPVATLYARSRVGVPIRDSALLTGGYFAAWVSAGLIAFVLALGAEEIQAGVSGEVATVIAAAVFGVCGLYQFSGLKEWCLRRCRSPLSLVLRYSSYRGAAAPFRAGLHHGAYCLGCCWALMALVFAFGMMNLFAMSGLAAVVLLEKLGPWDNVPRRLAGVGSFGLAVGVVFVPGLAPGLTGGGMAQ